jgi:hypothetical protein
LEGLDYIWLKLVGVVLTGMNWVEAADAENSEMGGGEEEGGGGKRGGDL